MNTEWGMLTQQNFEIDPDIWDWYRRQPDWSIIGKITYLRTYSRLIDNRKHETWFDTCRRVVNGTYSILKNHITSRGGTWDEDKSQASALRMFDAMFKFKFLPPGRGLWAMGTEQIRQHGGAALNNCAFVSTANLASDKEKPFLFVFEMLMQGVGVGFDVLGGGKQCVTQPHVLGEPYVVEDSRAGWVKALGYLLKSYFSNGQIHLFDYSRIRPAGQPLKTFGGVSCGPEPLIRLLTDVEVLLKTRRILSSTDILDIMNMIGRCVVAGNVRRSAQLALGRSDDQDFIRAKLDKEKLNAYRWASNNSILCGRSDDFNTPALSTAVNGEPGYIWLDNMRRFGRTSDPENYRDVRAMGTNPCGEQTLESYELCNLVETFPAHHYDIGDYLDTLKVAYLYAKAVTLVPVNHPETDEIISRNRRIGCSQSGITQAITKFGLNKTLDMCNFGYRFLEQIDYQYSGWLGVPTSVKKTSVKPSGTVSLLAGATPGIHFPHSEYYIRRIRFGAGSPLCEELAAKGYPVEPAVTGEGGMIVSFPVKEKFFTRGKRDVSMHEQLSLVDAYQRYWADNQVSATITFNKDEAKQITQALTMYSRTSKSLSFLPLDDHGYEQAPYEEISEGTYKTMMAKVKGGQLGEIDNVDLDDGGRSFCDGGACTLT